VLQGGFAPYDGLGMWRDIRIPAVLISAADGEKLRGLMPVDEIDIKGLGRQLVDSFVL
jgi:hypothetical protein